MPFSYPPTTTLGLVVIVVLAFATAGVTPGVVAAADTVISLDAASYSATQGAVVPVGVSLDGSSRVTLTVAASTGDYVATVTAVDANADGQVLLELNTFTAGQDDERQSYRVTDGDVLADVERLTPTQTTSLPPGNYSIIATAGDARADARLTLSPFTFGDATVETAPRDAVSPAKFLSASDTVAAGDWVVLRFDAPGLSGVVDTDRPVPVSNLVYADPSTPNARSIHTVRVPSPDDAPLRQLLVDYNGDDTDQPSRLMVGSTVTSVGIDRGGDGTVDVDLDDSLMSVSTHSSGRLRLQFDGQSRLSAGDVLVVRYDLVNPDMVGRDHVTVRLNDAPATTGTVTYGLAGQGTLGNGVTLDLVRHVDDETVPVSLTTAQYRVDAERGTLTVVLPAKYLDDQTDAEYVATLSLTAESPYARDAEKSRSVARFTVVPRTATVDGVVDGTLTVDNERARLSGTTSVAPGSRLVVYAARYDEPESFIQARLVTVDADGSWDSRFDFRYLDPGTEFEVGVYDRGRGGFSAPARSMLDPVAATVESSDERD